MARPVGIADGQTRRWAVFRTVNRYMSIAMAALIMTACASPTPPELLVAHARDRHAAMGHQQLGWGRARAGRHDQSRHRDAHITVNRAEDGPPPGLPIRYAHRPPHAQISSRSLRSCANYDH